MYVLFVYIQYIQMTSCIHTIDDQSFSKLASSKKVEEKIGVDRVTSSIATVKINTGQQGTHPPCDII